MKISHRKITASTYVKAATIPEPFAEYYEPISDLEFERQFDYPAHPSPCEEIPGYDVEFITYIQAKPEYAELLYDRGFDTLELISEGGSEPFVAYTVGDRIYTLDERELGLDEWAEDRDASYDDDDVPYEDDDAWFEEVEESTDIKGAVDTGLEYWYLTKHGMGPGTIPKDVTVLDWVEDGWDTYLLLDKMLTTSELNDYELKEARPPVGFETHNGKVIECSYDVMGSDCRKVAETEDSIKYVVSSLQDIDGMSLINYNSYKIRSNPQRGGYDVVDSEGNLVKSGMLTERAARNFIDDIEGCSSVFGAEDEDVDDVIVEDLEEATEESDEDDSIEEAADQEYDSAGTAINGKQGKLPSAFKALTTKGTIPSGALVLDYGGGTSESEEVAQAFLDNYDATEMLYDPYNQTAEHNQAVVKELRQAGGADVAVCSNVLNVIKEPEARLAVLRNIKKLLKSGASAYITVYEGSGSGEGSVTQKGKSYQNNLKLAGYLEEIQQVFPEAERRGSVIIAPKTNDLAIASSIDLGSIDVDKLKEEITEGCIEYLVSPEGGFLRPGEPSESKYDMYADEMFVVETESTPEYIKIEVRAELGYDSMMNLSAELDPIVEAYDEDAYFEMEEPGIMTAYIYGNDADTISGATYLQSDIPPMYQQEDDDEYDVNYEPLDDFDFDFDFVIEIDDEGEWEIDENASEESPSIWLIDEDMNPDQAMLESFQNLITWNIPDDAGMYRVKGHAMMSFDKDPGSGELICDYTASAITECEVTKIGKVELSTSVKASMTEAEVDKALAEGKSFDLGSFKKYKADDSDAISVEDIMEDDVIVIDDGDEINPGTVVKVISINDPEEDWIDYTLDCEVVEDPNRHPLDIGERVKLHYYYGDKVGKLRNV